MLTVKKWRTFFLNYIFGTLKFLIPMIVLSLVFSSGFFYLGQNTFEIFLVLFKSNPGLIFYSLLKVLGITFCICFALQVLISSFSSMYKLIFGFVFFISAIFRLSAMYPSFTENWYIVSHIESIRNLIQWLGTLPEFSRRRFFIESLPFFILTLGFLVNIIFHLFLIIKQSRIVKREKFSIQIDRLDDESKTFAIYGFSFVVSLLIGSFVLFYASTFFKIHFPQNKVANEKPNVFIFAIDSLRYDRLNDEKYKNVMPFLKSKIPSATLFKPMLVGVPRTFPSWVEIATGNYSLKTGIRTMFPSRSSRMEEKETIFSAAKKQGFNTLFISDFAGDIFPRYPFGANEIQAPTSNLQTMIENGLITFFSPLEAILTLPNMHRILPSFLESSEISDPRLLGHTLSNTLHRNSKNTSPVFLTLFFSTAHFPYPAPGPWFSKFQSKDRNGRLLFRKLPDQKIDSMQGLVSEKNNDSSFKTQTNDLYDGSLNAIDSTLKNIFHELENKGWLKNSIILIFGDHGENLYDGNLGMGHGDGVQGEFANVTPLVIFTNGNAKPQEANFISPNIVRSIDIAPTIAKRANINFPKEEIDGKSLLDSSTSSQTFPTHLAYMESGIWFTKNGKLTPEHMPRVVYPDMRSLLDVDANFNQEFYLKSSFSQTVVNVKERAWINDIYKLVMRTLPTGTQASLYLRTDTTAQIDLLKETVNQEKYKKISSELLRELNNYLTKHGVDIISNSDGSFFYAENISQ